MRLIVAEDSAILRDGLVALLARRGHDVVEAVGDAAALEAHVAHLARTDDLPDVVVTDVRMPPTFTDEGLRAAVALRAAHPDLGVLVFSQHVETRYASDLLASGAQGVGYLLKEASSALRAAMEEVLRPLGMTIRTQTAGRLRQHREQGRFGAGQLAR